MPKSSQFEIEFVNVNRSLNFNFRNMFKCAELHVYINHNVTFKFPLKTYPKIWCKIDLLYWNYDLNIWRGKWFLIWKCKRKWNISGLHVHNSDTIVIHFIVLWLKLGELKRLEYLQCVLLIIRCCYLTVCTWSTWFWF